MSLSGGYSYLGRPGMTSVQKKVGDHPCAKRVLRAAGAAKAAECGLADSASEL
jgi:hypothetical protein